MQQGDYPTAIRIELDELRERGIAAYANVIDAGAEMIMTSATTFPAFDDEHVLADGATTGYYPATMSSRIVTGLLREELGYDGVVISDALEMEQFFVEPDTGAAILQGEKYGVERAVSIAQKSIEAGCDILLIPTDLASDYAVSWYDEYVSGIVSLVEAGALSETRVNESVLRILALKERRGVLDLQPLAMDVEAAVAHAREVVGSDEHHAIERGIAEQAVTLLKGGDVLPIEADGKNVVIVGRTEADSTPVMYALSELRDSGVINESVRIDNLITGEALGYEDSISRIVVGHYYDPYNGGYYVSDTLSQAIVNADYVVCLSAVSAGTDAIQDYNVQVQGVNQLLWEAHAAGACFVLLSDNIPVDAVRFPDADAVVCCYLSSGFDIDPTTGSGSENMHAINANVPAAVRAILGAADMPGALPIDVSTLAQDSSGTWVFTDEIAYPRGSSLT